jgi:hypothetical protein
MKLENNWRQKSLENLEKSNWGEQDFDSHLVTTCHKLRRKPLDEFLIEDLRIMIGQNIGLKFLIPLALEQLNKNILTEGDYYEGDLLQAVLNSEAEFWQKNKILFDKLNLLVHSNIEAIKMRNIKLTEFENLKKLI